MPIAGKAKCCDGCSSKNRSGKCSTYRGTVSDTDQMLCNSSIVKVQSPKELDAARRSAAKMSKRANQTLLAVQPTK